MAVRRAEVRQGFGGHDGLVADTLIGWNDRIGTPGKNLWLYGVGLRATIADRDYTNVYFGVNRAQATATGLPISPTGSGLVSAGVNASLTKPLGRMGQNGAFTLFTGYDRLGGVVGRSALIAQRGQRDQFSAGLGYGYRFSWD